MATNLIPVDLLTTCSREVTDAMFKILSMSFWSSPLRGAMAIVRSLIFVKNNKIYFYGN
jgi:hypothetical protein